MQCVYKSKHLKKCVKNKLYVVRINCLFICFFAALFVGLCVRRVFELMLGVVLAYFSIPVVQNLLSSRQAMNTSFDSFRIVNTYGAFGRYFK